MARSKKDRHKARTEILDDLQRNPGMHQVQLVKAIMELCVTVDESAEDIGEWLKAILNEMPS
jgi:hypothetical protein